MSIFRALCPKRERTRSVQGQFELCLTQMYRANNVSNIQNNSDLLTWVPQASGLSLKSATPYKWTGNKKENESRNRQWRGTDKMRTQQSHCQRRNNRNDTESPCQGCVGTHHDGTCAPQKRRKKACRQRSWSVAIPWKTQPTKLQKLTQINADNVNRLLPMKGI